MRTLKTFDVESTFANEKEAINFASLFDFSDSELSENSIAYLRYVDTVNGIDVFYCYGSDSFYFSPSND